MSDFAITPTLSACITSCRSPRALAAPIVAILRDNSYLQRVQAAAVGATFLFPANVSVSDISSALAPVIRSAIPWVAPTTSLAPAQNIEQARLHFGTIFNSAARGEGLSRTSVDNSTASVVAAIAAGGIRQWLEVVWTYDEATYQDCLLVTGLAAEFAARDERSGTRYKGRPAARSWQGENPARHLEQVRNFDKRRSRNHAHSCQNWL
jgi:hypothetical protein